MRRRSLNCRYTRFPDERDRDDGSHVLIGEVFGQDPLPQWIEEQTLAQPLAAQIIAARLGPGEREAIALALELRATLLLIDALPARRLAQSLNIPVMGTLGLLLRAKNQGLIPVVKPLR